MSLTRRRFIETASLTLLASAALPNVFAQTGHDPKDDTFDSDRLTIFYGVSPLTFKSLIGESFKVSSENRSLASWELLSVTEEDPTKPAANMDGEPVKSQAKLPIVGRQPKPSKQTSRIFSLRFQGRGTPLPQGTYTLHHDALGSFPLLVVPTRPAGSPMTYLAIFNLLNPEPRG
jgi:hypothetical protein